MAKPYSYDLRQKVIQAIEWDGMKKSEAAQVFQISRNTIDLWLKRRTETGDLHALPNHPPGNGHKITDWDKFQEFAKTHGDKTQAEMAALWSDDISARTLRARIAENRLHPEKKTYGYRERDEVKRQEFALALTSKTHSMIVYVDEAGMDARDDYAYGAL